MSEINLETLATFVRAYSDAFGASVHANDPALLRPYCHVPSTAVGGGRVAVFATEEQSDARWARAHAAMPEDYGHSVLHTVEVSTLGDNSAFATVDCSRYRKTGEEYQRLFFSYVLVRTADGWRIKTWISHDGGGAVRREVC